MPRTSFAGRGAAQSSRGRRSRTCGRARAALVAAAVSAPCLLAAQQPTPTPTPPLTLEKREPSPLSGAMPAPTLTNPSEAAAPAAARIAQIAVEGGKTVTPETIAFYLGVKVGDAYDPALLTKNFVRLWDSGLFDDLRLEEEDVPAGKKIVAYVVERPRVTDLEFRGNKKMTASSLKDKLKEGKAEIKVGGAVTLRDLSKAKAVLLDVYHAEGFRSAAVEATMEAINETERRVVFVIDEGDKIKIESITFTGNKVFSSARLRRAMKKTHQRHWYTFWDTKTVYNQTNYEDDVEEVRHVYQNAGYKDVVVKDPQIETYVVNPKAKPGKIKRRARITIPIVEGEKFFFGKVTVDGAVVFKGANLEKGFQYKPGKPLNRQILVDGMKGMDELYRSRGYIYVFMNPEYEEKANHVVDVAIKITEGDQYRLGRVEFSGNKTTRDKVLRRELILSEGDLMNMEAFKKGLFKITQLGYFKIEEDPEFRVVNEKKTVDVTIKGTDTNRNEVQFGAGYSQLDGIFGQFSFSTRNFLGRGDTVGIQLQRGNRSNFFDLSFSEPFFLDKRMSLGASIFNRSLTYLDVDQRTRGVNLSYGLGIGLFDVASFFYGFTDTKSRYEVFPPPPAPGSAVPPLAFADFSGTTSAITPGYRYDSRNDPFDPSRGKRYGLSVTLAGGPLGGDFSFIKPAFSVTYYVPATRRSNFALNLEASYVRPYGGRDIPIFERFRIGGDRSVRGFEFGAIFPTDSSHHAFFNEAGALLGGDRFLVVNLEYVYQIAGPLKIAAFFDAGQTWLEGQSMNLLKMRSSTGLEMRIFLPIFQAPLRFIYGINLHPVTLLDQQGFPLPNGVEKRTNFQFSIGTTF